MKVTLSNMNSQKIELVSARRMSPFKSLFIADKWDSLRLVKRVYQISKGKDLIAGFATFMSTLKCFDF